MIRCIIIDDERLARNELKSLLSGFSQLEIIAETGDPEEAVETINQLAPDLIFLDIQMPGMNGFELLEKIDKSPEVIFVTAYDDFALKAFQVNALSYLVKPVDSKLFSEIVEKQINKIKFQNFNPKEESKHSIQYLDKKDKVFVKDGDRCWFVQLDKIELFESEGNYVKLYFDDEKPMIHKTLNNLEEKLNPQNFFRANRKYIINLDYVDNIESWFSGSLLVKTKSGKEIELSRRQSAKFKEIMSL